MGARIDDRTEEIDDRHGLVLDLVFECREVIGQVKDEADIRLRHGQL